MKYLKPTWQTLKNLLKRRADNPKENFMLLLIGFGVFMLGLLIIGYAQYFIWHDLAAELVALAGLILLIGGMILAAIGYISLSVLRILRFLDSDDDNTNTPS
ncbi:hypothetical protein [Nitrincola nitratireducens]|uniref:Uncharacterized protein n=2 Tax=Nitrincola TaxID=267849 RepID=W9UYD4_9GAMM|nr:hypothetical protein [Nitrincola nitratireducens]EXJ12099.1 hypothetical protein D791_00988 [Nitrincola nitratireducens]